MMYNLIEVLFADVCLIKTNPGSIALLARFIFISVSAVIQTLVCTKQGDRDQFEGKMNATRTKDL